MSEFVMVKRELLERILCCISYEEADELRAVLAQEAGPVVERQDPVLDLESAAKVLANCMDYPWEHMPENGRALMRKHARCIVDAALAQPNKSGASE